MMARHESEIAMESDRKHKKPRMEVENSFNQQITITQSGQLNW
jgi:hypothetical protein